MIRHLYRPYITSSRTKTSTLTSKQNPNWIKPNPVHKDP